MEQRFVSFRHTLRFHSSGDKQWIVYKPLEFKHENTAEIFQSIYMSFQKTNGGKIIDA